MSPVEQILVIDDESGICELIAATAQKLALSCATSTSAAAFLEKLTPDTALVLMDLMMPEMDGVELLRLLGEKQCRAGIVLMSGTDTRIMETAEQFAQSIGLAVAGRLKKPFRLTELEAVLKLHKTPVKPRGPGQKKHALNLNADLYSGIQRNEFLLHYQPQIDLKSRKIIGMEALVRWQHPERGLIYPDDFIAQAEELGLIDQLGWFVANRGMEEIALFANGSVPMLSINVSVHSLRDLKFPEKYLSLLKKNKVEPENTILEITESGLIQELSTTLDVLTRLRLKGVQLSIDDFGTGYSMMQQLRNMPATELKIDKSFVQNIGGAASNRIMVQKTIEIGHELGMKVVAEGVETPDQLEFLLAHGCDVAQGYLFSKPLAPQDMQAWLHTYHAKHTL